MINHSPQLRRVSDSVATCSLLLTIVVLIGIGVLSYRSTQLFLDNNRKVAHTHQVLSMLALVLSDLKDAETGQRGYLLTDDPTYLQPYRSGSASTIEDIQSLRALTRDNLAQQRRLDTLQALSALKLAELDQTIRLRETIQPTAALKIVKTGRGKRLMDDARAVVSQMQAAEQRLLTERTAAAERSGSAARLWSVLGTLLAILLIVTAIGFVGNYLRQRERAEADNLRLVEVARDAAVQQRTFLKDVLASVTEGRLILCDTESELPALLPVLGDPIPLTREAGPRGLRQAAIQAARACGFPEERVQDLATSVSEAGMNAITHGSGGEAIIRSDMWEHVQVCITDHGKGIALDTLPQSTLERGYSSAGTLGHGFWLMLRMCDRVSLLTGPDGTTVVLEQTKAAQAAPWTRQETSEVAISFKTADGGSSSSVSNLDNLSYRIL